MTWAEAIGAGFFVGLFILTAVFAIEALVRLLIMRRRLDRFEAENGFAWWAGNPRRFR